ncbi:hypothetical protein D9C73_001586 [Collichthys lucidus]|uniref:Uncharacterized protein n=1 Tax=Collichthys lucidus TaxID=240159 RepID=A0A4U5U195_COLLU|nr:hypothetical protein D9C73_001619 [Collichthys lucidus]TKS67091.1 hypothetical protein D9C73_001586 [Collichthys lucidus]
MGNCTSGIKKKKKGDSAPCENNSEDNKPEDVTYASIDHSNMKGSRKVRTTMEDDCDYTVITLPARQPEPDPTSKDDCEDDYVLMG